MSGIVTILPKDEGFSPARFGAISLCVRDFTLASRYRDDITVISGLSDAGFDHIDFLPAPAPRWYENRTRAYAAHGAKVARRKQAALVEVHNRPALLRLLAPKLHCKLALHLHNDPQEMRHCKTPAERTALLAKCDAVYCVSEFIRRRFLEGIGAGTTKAHVVHNGIALPAMLPPKEKLILFAGRMTEGKGALLLAQALAIAMPLLPEWRAVLVGSDRHSASDTPSTHEALVIDTMRGVPRASMAGFLNHEETLALFARAAIAVVPSLWQEPFGRTAIEAMAYGCALISSGRGALLEVTGDAAFTLDELTPPALAAAIIMLTREHNLRETLGGRARLRAPHFAIAKCAATLDKIREHLL